ncbi:MAG: hypothetical protein WBW48_12710 [Anaerolineae bacterium]
MAISPFLPHLATNFTREPGVLDATILPHPVHPRKAVDLPERITPQRIGHLGGMQ